MGGWHAICFLYARGGRRPAHSIAVPQPRKGSSMTQDYRISRRAVLASMSAGAVFSALPLGSARAAGSLTVGFIYVGPKDDYGYNQAHAAGAAAVKKIPGVKIAEQELVPETDKVQKTMEDMIETDGAKAVFPTS